jgi:hypothetical protein
VAAPPKPVRRIVCRLKTTPADKAALKKLAAGDSVALGALFDDKAAEIYGSQDAPKPGRAC